MPSCNRILIGLIKLPLSRDKLFPVSKARQTRARGASDASSGERRGLVAAGSNSARVRDGGADDSSLVQMVGNVKAVQACEDADGCRQL